ncbi:hypothetical protein DVDV_4011 [Desulfovibrio sp. DV]|nr:hypothetical protein DVDV_4011 [Desulfovibrio sp. DV]
MGMGVLLFFAPCLLVNWCQYRESCISARSLVAGRLPG